VYVGGLKNVSVLLERPGQLHTDDFIGCIHSLEINGRASNITSPLESRGVSETCQHSPTICDPGNHQCGAQGKCIDLWDTYTCRCPDITAPNCEEALAPYTLRSGAFLEFRPGERYNREQLLQSLYVNYREPKQGIDISAKSISFSFRTMQANGVLLYAASNKDFTMLEVSTTFKVIRIPRREFEFSNDTVHSLLICDVINPRNSTFDSSLDSQEPA